MAQLVLSSPHQGSYYCADPEGLGPISNLRELDFTRCFERTVESGLVGLFGLIAAGRCVQLWEREKRAETDVGRRLIRAKIVMGVVPLLVLSCAILVLELVQGRAPLISAPTINALVGVFAYAAFGALVYLNHTRTRRSSTILLTFWPLWIIERAIALRTEVLIGNAREASFGLGCAVLGVGLISWTLECFCPDRTKLDPDADPEERELPYERANVYSRLTFGWMTPLMKLGYSRFITERDMSALSSSDTAHALSSRLQHHWSQQLRTKNPSLWVALFRAYGAQYSVAAVIKTVRDVLAFAEPQLLRFLLAFIASYQAGGEERSAFIGWVIAGGMFLLSVVQTAMLHQYFQICFVTGMRVRAGLVTAIYNKALVQASDSQGARGDVVNLMSVDATRLQDLCTYGLIAFSGPLQIVLAFVSLYNLLGWPAFVGVAIMVVSLPLNTFIARVLKKMQGEQMKNRDKRTRLMSELLNNIKSIKLYAWEDSFIRKILTVRNEQELKMLKKIGVTTAVSTTLWTGVPLLVAFGSFATAAYTGSKPLTADIIFPCISLFNLLQFPLAMFASITSQLVEAVVAVTRIRKFLLSEELQDDARKVNEDEVAEGDIVLEITNADFKWSKTAVEPTLQHVDLSLRKGDLVGVLGKVGCGKTSLLSAIVGEMIRAEGMVDVRGKVAYAPQNAWIMNATIRENILFSHAYDEEFYNVVLDACALRPDLALFSDGDLTEVGEKGITLSGGQRARISLARTVYARADLYLLDDPLAAVDAHVARHVFDQVVGPNGLLAGKARLHVTNSVAYLEQHDTIMMIRRGIILESGTFAEITGDPTKELAKLITNHKKGNTGSRGQSGTATPINPPTDLQQSTSTSDDTTSTLTPSVLPTKLSPKTLSRPEILSVRSQQKLRAKMQAEAGTTQKVEHREQGNVKMGVYKRYFQASSVPGVIVYMICMVMQQACSIMSNVLLKMWGNHNQEEGDNSAVGYYLFMYGMLALGSALFAFTASVLLWVFCAIKSARSLHDAMLLAVIRAPLSFFEQTPMGRIMNLFSRDQYVIDEVLIRVFSGFFRTMLVVTGIVVVVGGTFPWFLLTLIPLGFVYRVIMLYYLATSRELKRLDAVSKSPIFAWFQESLGGLSTIRAFNQQEVFMTQNEAKLDRNQMVYLPAVSVNRWLAVRLELLGSCIVLSAAIFSLVALVTTGVDAGLVGLVLSYGLSTTQSLNWVVRSASEVEQNLVSVERVVGYINLEPEAPLEIPDAPLPTGWPETGEIEFKDYCMRYRPELPLVLKDLSMKIRSGENVGVVGRTGAGKSSLFLSLLRILEPASGTIFINGVDITKIGLHDLRRAISIIPQEPQLFEGSIRENVDPTDEYDDGKIWAAIEQAHLKEYVLTLPGGLDSIVKEGGSSMSSGQRQLVCFARALLRNTKILILDEATSAVDLDTDKAIQEIIRGPQFKGVTTLTIAHRLNTVIESDRILVLENGSVAELDSPAVLLKNESSLFYALAAEAGVLPKDST
ncbi:metal resistance protein YCF1 [Ceratobasidium sp. AG-I]|nr:metal resistance protein YCF1 [Ceratobasidium sp. AG-I]